MPTITVDAQGRPPPMAKALPMKIQLNADDTVADIKHNVQLHFPRMAYDRQKISLDGRKPLDDSTTIRSLGDATTVYLKDMGPQISWRTVYVIEYLGPLIFHPLFYYVPQIYTSLFGKTFVHSDVQRVAFTLIMVHYFKREFESMFVHRFSHATMPVFNIFKNSGHYWGLSGILLAASLYGPWYSAGSLQGSLRDNPTWIRALTAVWAFAELSNLKIHYTLRNLRPSGTRARGIPYGYGFTWLSCPNYFFEIMAWISIILMTWDPMMVIFLTVGTIQMYFWAIKKHKIYKKEFGAQYPRRWVMIPFVV